MVVKLLIGYIKVNKIEAFASAQKRFYKN